MLFWPVQCASREAKWVVGSFAPNGSSAVSAASVEGDGFTVARTSAGVFTVTLSEKYMALLGGGAWFASNAASRVQLQLGAADVEGAQTVVIRAVDPCAVGGVAALGATSNLPASNATLSTSDTYTDAAVKTAIDGAVDALKTAAEARLDAIEAKVDALIAAGAPAATDVSAHANNRINFAFLLSKTAG